MTTYGSEVLYREATGLEKAWADVDADRLINTYVEAIIDIWDPWNCPLKFLPFLAFAMGVTFWNNDWSETTKRTWLDRQWEFKAKRGTQSGVEMAVDFAGRDVSPFGYKAQKFITQPQKIFSGPSLTKEQREAWLSLLPQVRVYYFRNAPIAPLNKAFLGARYAPLQKSLHFFTPNQFMIPSEAKDHLARKATYNINGVDTDIPVTDFGNYFQLHLFAQEGEKVFCGRPFGLPRFYIPSDAWKRLITIRPVPTAPWRITIGPSYDAVDASPEIVKIAGQRGLGVYTGSNYQHGTGSLMNHKNFFIPSTSKYRIFDRYAVNDGSQYIPRPNQQFMGTGRYGWPAFTAEVDVHMPSRRNRYAAGDGVFIPKQRFWIPHDPKPLAYVRAAIESSRRLIDKILLRPVPIVQFIAGKSFVAGVDTFIVGRPSA